MVDLVYYPTNLLFLDIPLLYYYIAIINSFASSGNIYRSLVFSLDISLS